jgi:Holliday junction resolvasome RuvABC endonuclease subunit
MKHLRGDEIILTPRIVSLFFVYNRYSIMFYNLNRDCGSVEGGTLIGIDPGSETLGVGILTFGKDFEILKIEAATYRGSKLPILEDTELIHGARHSRIQAHYHNLFALFLQYQPIGIACESPFFQAARPQAYGALTEVVGMIRAAVLNYRPNLSVNFIDPPNVKRAVGAKGNADKDAVRAAILTIQAIVDFFIGPVPIEMLDEHSLDSIAAVYGYYLSLRGD